MAEPQRLRHATGYACGDETRRKIISAAIAQFGQQGFEAATTREIAARAGVNAPALRYYFQSKEGLYRACAESLADDAWEALEPAVVRAQNDLDRDAPVEELIESFLAIQSVVVDLRLVRHGQLDQRLFFAREQGGCEPEAGSQVLHERLRDPLNVVNIALLARISNIREDDPRTIVRMFSLYGQFLLFFLAHGSALSALRWVDIDREKAEFLGEHIGKQTRLLLESWYNDGKTAPRKESKSSPGRYGGSDVCTNSPSQHP